MGFERGLITEEGIKLKLCSDSNIGYLVKIQSKQRADGKYIPVIQNSRIHGYVSEIKDLNTYKKYTLALTDSKKLNTAEIMNKS